MNLLTIEFAILECMYQSIMGIKEENVAELAVLRSKRGYTRGRVTRKYNALNPKIEELSLTECNVNLENLGKLSEELTKINDDIGNLLMITEGENSLDQELSDAEVYEEYLQTLTCKLRERISTLSATELSPGTVPGSGSYPVPSGPVRENTKMKLPEMPLPYYSHTKGESILEFFSNFEDIINKYTLSEYERYVFLERQLSGDPRMLIKSLTGSNRCYAKAKELLNKAFARPIRQKFETIGQLLKIKFESSQPYKFVSDVQLIISSFEELKIDIKTILQYFVWSNLPTKYQNQLMHLTVSHYPDLDKILDSIYEAIDQVRDMDESCEPEAEPLSLAANVHTNATRPTTQKFKPCNLCNEPSKQADHPIFKCNVYPNAKSKIDRLKELNLCTKCANIKHSTKECRFKFSRPCHHCTKSNHFSFLCFREADKPKSESHDKTIISSVCSVDLDTNALISKCKSQTLLPTFSCKTMGDTELRVLQDSGAQTSFINSDLARSCKFNIVNSNINLNIRGFNEQKTVKTNIVEVAVELDGKLCHIPAVCVPNLTSMFPNPDLPSIAKILVSRGWGVADSFVLSDSNKELDMILGADSFHHLKFKCVSFGRSSCFFDSNLGIMPIGNGRDFIADSVYLPNPPSGSCDNVVVSSIACDPIASISSLDATGVASSPVCGEREVSVNITNLMVSCDQSLIELKDTEIQNLKSSALDNKCAHVLNYDNIDEDEISVSDQLLCDEVLSKIKTDEENRIIVKVLWNDSNSHLLPCNLNLCKKLLMSIKAKVEKIPDGLEMVDNAIQDQINASIVEPINDLETFMNSNKNVSFLAHMPVIKENNATTKCRIVLLSNLREKSDDAVSHNQAMQPGPQLNRPIETALTLLRFDKNLLIYDLRKAFHQLKLDEEDSNRLCFLWFKDVSKGDFTIQAYRCVRLPIWDSVLLLRS